MRKMTRAAAFVLALLLALTTAAEADVKYGDAGDEVLDIQQMLFDIGFLFSQPDGRFGPKTEDAVKNFQECNGYDVTGVVTDEVRKQILDAWYICVYGVSDPSEIEVNGIADYPCNCNQMMKPDGSCQTVFCEFHSDLNAQTEALLATGDAEDAYAARMLWQEEIMALYDEWQNLLPDEAQSGAIAARTLFLSSVEAQCSALHGSFDAVQTDVHSAEVEARLAQWLRGQAAWMCSLFPSLTAFG